MRGLLSQLSFPSGLAVFFTLLPSVTYNLLFALGEIAWRGFLRKYTNRHCIQRNLFTGFLWGAWWLVFKSLAGDSMNLFDVSILYGACFVSSFLLDQIMTDSDSLLTSAAIQGILISSFPLYFFMKEGVTFAGIYSGTGLLSLLILLLVFKFSARRKRPV